MYSIFYYVSVYIILAALGMSIANRKVKPLIQKQRWLKFFTYIIITGVVLASILLHFFQWVASIIVFTGLLELLKLNFRSKRIFVFLSFLTYGLLACGFIYFSLNFKTEAVLFIYFQVLIFDAFGQITGQLFGKRLLVPGISPSKTIEGLIGGWLFCIVAAFLGSEWVHLSSVQALLFGVFTGLTSFCGDTLASWFKRLHQIKDYSNWLPGQGGFLDRFDSFIFTGAVYYLITVFFPIFNSEN